MKLVDAKGREVTNKIFSPKRRGPKQKRISNDERKQSGNGEEVPFSLSLLDWSSRLPLKNKNQKNTRALPTTGTRTIKPRKKEQECFFTLFSQKKTSTLL